MHVTFTIPRAVTQSYGRVAIVATKRRDKTRRVRPTPGDDRSTMSSSTMEERYRRWAGRWTRHVKRVLLDVRQTDRLERDLRAAVK